MAFSSHLCHGKLGLKATLANFAKVRVQWIYIIFSLSSHHWYSNTPWEDRSRSDCCKINLFGADGVSSFQGCRNGVSKQLLENWSPYVLHVHYYGHRFNLVVKALSDFDIVSDIEDLVKVVHAYFAHSPKKYSEFHSLALLMETKGLTVKKCLHSLVQPYCTSTTCGG